MTEALKNTKLSIDEAQEIVDKWIESVGVRYFNELTNLGILMEEVGELSRIMVRLFELIFTKVKVFFGYSKYFIIFWSLICIIDFIINN